MGDFYKDPKLNPQTASTGWGSTLLAVLAGIYVVFKALELLGYPVWLWVYMAGERISTLRLWGARCSENTNVGEDAQDTDVQRGGNVLSSVFGLHSSSLLQKGVRGVTGALSKGANDVPPGLGNWDNSCYQNSVIQGLASLPSLRDYLSKTTDEYRTLGTETTNGALFDMIRKLSDPENHGQHFWIRGKLKSMSTFQQQDAQEYYSKILDALDKEVQSASTRKRRSTASWLDVAMSLNGVSVAAAGNEETSAVEKKDEGAQTPPERPKIVPNPLDGLLAQRVGCINCSYSEGLQLIPFNCVTVSLGRNYIYDIRECLDEYTNLEYIEGVECAKCTLLKLKGTLAPLAASGAPFQAKLQAVEEALEDEDFDDKTLVKKFNILKKNWVQSTKSRQAVIARAPKALVLHVNRSIFDEMTGAQYKNTAAVQYPRTFDLGNWCLGSRPSESHLPDNAAEEWPRDPRKSMIGDTHVEPTTTSPFQYQLRAAVTHFGTHGNGHYVCYRPHATIPELQSTAGEAEEASGEQWYRFSDDTVYAVQESQAHQGNVFMLFYERVDERTPSPQNGQEAAEDTPPVEADIPLPPADFSFVPKETIDDTAAEVPLPEHDEESLPDLATSPGTCTPPATSSEPSTPVERPTTPQAIKFGLSAYPTPPPEIPSTLQREDTEPSEADSEDTTSTDPICTGEMDTQPTTPAPQHKISPSPHLMRTAGQSLARDGDSRRSLPMVTAT